MQGYIKDEIYYYWMLLRRKKYEKPSEKPFDCSSITYKEGWEYAIDESCLEQHRYKFQEFMDEILNIDVKREIKEILKQYEPPLRKRFFRWFGIYIS